MFFILGYCIFYNFMLHFLTKVLEIKIYKIRKKEVLIC